jgi:hypothetical protein
MSRALPALLGRAGLAILLAAMAGALPYILLFGATDGPDPLALVRDWFVVALVCVVAIGLPLGALGALVLNAMGRETLFGYLLAAIVAAGLFTCLLAAFEPVFILMLPGALAAGLTLGLGFWRLIRGPQLRRRRAAAAAPGSGTG